MPLGHQVFSMKGLHTGGVIELTMSSGSSGKSVMVPEPSLSIFCLISRIVFVVQTALRDRE